MTNILPFNFGSSKQTRAAIHDDLVCVPEITTAVAFHWVEGGTEHFYASKDGTDDMSAIAHTVELTECRFERIELPEDHRDHLYSVTAQCSIDGVAGEMVFVAGVSYDQRKTALGAQYSPTHALRLLFASFGSWVCQEACRIQALKSGNALALGKSKGILGDTGHWHPLFTGQHPAQQVFMAQMVQALE